VTAVGLLFFNLMNEGCLKLFLFLSLDDGHVLKWVIYLRVLESICLWFWLAILLIDSYLIVKHLTIELGLFQLSFTFILLYSLPVQHLDYYYYYYCIYTRAEWLCYLQKDSVKIGWLCIYIFRQSKTAESKLL
jgi:hypothetical protein